jgi:hypothetical protein
MHHWVRRAARFLARCFVIVARMLPIGPGGPQASFGIPRYVSRDFRNNNKNRSADSPPPPVPPPVPGAPPVLGPLVWSAEGLPSTRNWPFRCPLPPPSPPQVIPKAM